MRVVTILPVWSLMFVIYYCNRSCPGFPQMNAFTFLCVCLIKREWRDMCVREYVCVWVISILKQKTDIQIIQRKSGYQQCGQKPYGQELSTSISDKECKHRLQACIKEYSDDLLLQMICFLNQQLCSSVPPSVSEAITTPDNWADKSHMW